MEYMNNALVMVMEGKEDLEESMMEHVQALEFLISRNELVPLNWLFLDHSPHIGIFNEFGIEKESSLVTIHDEDPILAINKALRDQNKKRINFAYLTSGQFSSRVRYVTDELLADFEVSIKNIRER